MLSDEIATYLASQGLGLTMGSTGTGGIFNVPFPTEAGDTATCVIEYPGMEPIRAMGPSLSVAVFEQPKFQVVSRDITDRAYSCRMLMDNIFANLTQLSATLTGGDGSQAFYGFIEPMQSPFFLKYDANGRILYSCNFRAKRRPVTVPHIVQEDGTSKFTLEDGTGAIASE